MFGHKGQIILPLENEIGEHACIIENYEYWNIKLKALIICSAQRKSVPKDLETHLSTSLTQWIWRDTYNNDCVVFLVLNSACPLLACRWTTRAINRNRSKRKLMVVEDGIFAKNNRRSRGRWPKGPLWHENDRYKYCC